VFYLAVTRLLFITLSRAVGGLPTNEAADMLYMGGPKKTCALGGVASVKLA